MAVALSPSDELMLRSPRLEFHPSMTLAEIHRRAVLHTLCVIRLCLRQGLYAPAEEALGLLVAELPYLPPRLARFITRELARLRCALAVALALSPEHDLA